MAISYITASELFVGANSAKFPNALDKPALYIENQMLTEHNADGTHKLRDTSVFYEAGTYTGDGALQQVISLANSTLQPVYLEISGIIWWEGFPLHYSVTNWASATVENSWIYSTDTGEFTVGYYRNVSPVVYYYLVLGLETSPGSAGGGGSDPTWLPDSTAMNATNANLVQTHEETQFLVEHNDNGTHKSGYPYTANIVMESGSYQGNGNNDRIILLDNTDLTIGFLWLTSDYGATAITKGYPYQFVTQSAPSGYFIESVGIGRFTCNDTYGNINGDTYWWCAIGT